MENKERIYLIEKIFAEKKTSSEELVQYSSVAHIYDEEHHLYMREAHFIDKFDGKQTCSMAELAEKMRVTPGAVSQVASRLEKKGYIVRFKDDRDRRKSMVRLTAKGEEFYHTHKAFDYERYAAVDKHYLNKFSLEELTLFYEYEKIMIDIFKSANKEET